MKSRNANMKAQRRHLGALEFINDILLARARLAQARSDLAVANARAQTAKRRGDRNGPVAHSARKQARHAEMEFMRAGNILAKMEKQYFASVQHAQSGRKSLPAQVKRSAHAVRLMKEKKPVIVFRGYPIQPANAPVNKKQNPING
jgi:hypothetical protein